MGKLDRDVVSVVEENIASCQQGIDRLRKKLDKVKITPLRSSWKGQSTVLEDFVSLQGEYYRQTERDRERAAGSFKFSP